MIQLFMETMFKLPFMIDNKFLNVKALLCTFNNEKVLVKVFSEY